MISLYRTVIYPRLVELRCFPELQSAYYEIFTEIWDRFVDIFLVSVVLTERR
jgi:hypothetical protein